MNDLQYIYTGMANDGSSFKDSLREERLFTNVLGTGIKNSG